MKRIMKISVAVLIATVVAGCASVTYTSPGMLDNVSVKGVEGRKLGQTVLINTSGFYLFWTMPIVSGDLTWNDQKKSIEGGSSFFSDQVGVDELQSILLKIAEARTCDLADVYVHDSDASYAGASYGGAVGACFGSSYMSISAILVPRVPAK